MDFNQLAALHISHVGAWLDDRGVLTRVDRQEAKALTLASPVMIVNAPLVGARLGFPEVSGLDLLELFAFVHPARFAVPTVAGLCDALDLPPPAEESANAPAIRSLAARLLATIGDSAWPERDGAAMAARGLERARWSWSAFVRAAIRDSGRDPGRSEPWLFSALPEWDEQAPRPPAREHHIDPEALADHLDALLGPEGEARPAQRAYAAAAADAFAPRDRRDSPRIVLAEAGTGTGKTLGYLAPASLWAAEAGGPVWISTFTKALQRQLGRESARIYPDPAQHRRRVVIRKGRENYLCLLNLEEAMQGAASGRGAVFAHLVARWTLYSRDGDMVGGDLPGWLPTLFRRSGTAALTDRRGECIYAGCPHYRRCYIERATRSAEAADLVIANHALVLVQAVQGQQQSPTRYVFDEGHHLFGAADSAFSAVLSGAEAIEMRRWIIGREGSRRGRRRGLSARLADVASYDSEAGVAIETAVAAAMALPSDEWLARVCAGAGEGPVEALLHEIRATVLARAQDAGRAGDSDPGYGLEAELADPPPPLIEAAQRAADALTRIAAPLRALDERLERIVADPPDWLDGDGRSRIEGSRIALGRRADTLAAWVAMLLRIGGPGDPDLVDWMTVERFDGREYDIALRRHWLDPTRPLADHVLRPAHGALITSATLRSGGDWDQARALTGAVHLGGAPAQFTAESPFDYARQARVLIVTDVKRGDIAALSGAYGRLIEASGGGALGLFTAIRRLRAVHARIVDRLARSGLPVFAQHVDPMDVGTLVDLFRADPAASLLGTDSLRDGIDVPGDTLRLVVMEGVPWPKPSVLHAARKLAWDGQDYNDRIVRARLAQAFGRLIRRHDDRGVFVLLSSAVPSRMLNAFPPDVPVGRVTLDEAVVAVRGLVDPQAPAEGATVLPAPR